MSYTTNQLISGAFYAASVVSREFETVSGQQITDGLQWLNEILAEKVVEEGMVPYETTYDFDFIIGQEKYYVPGLIEVNTLVFYKDTVRFPMMYTKRNQYFGSPRVEQITTLPYTWYFERGFGGGTIYVYFLPDMNYPVEVHGIFALPPVSLGQDLSLTYDLFYITYLRYALADRICSEYDYSVPQNVTTNLRKYESMINKKSRVLDLRLTKISTLYSDEGARAGWGWVNLGKGFWPS